MSPRVRQRQGGTSIATFALIAPVLMFIIFGITEGSRVMFTWMVITNEAAEAARYGAVRYDDLGDLTVQRLAIEAFIDRRLDGILDPDGLLPAPSVVIAATTPPTVTVTLTYKVDLVIPIISQVLPNPFPLKARSIMAAESSES